MTAYKPSTLVNLAIRGEVEEALHRNLITPQRKTAIMYAYPVDLYQPNLFVRIGLGILTTIILVAGFGLTVIVTEFNSPAALCSFWALASYGFLELMTTRNKHCNSGVDNILMIACVVMGTAAIVGIADSSKYMEVIMCLAVCVLALYLFIRFADGLMAVVSAGSFMLLLLFLGFTFGNTGMLILPFVLMIASAAAYLIMAKGVQNKVAVFYVKPLFYAGIVMLIAFYLVGNYYVVDILSRENLQPHTYPSIGRNVGWFFWLFTMAVPLIYLAIGINKKDVAFIRLGLLLAICSVLTFRYYHAVLAAEVAMLFCGVLVIAAVYMVAKYLRRPRFGFSFDNKHKKNQDALNLEGFIVGEAFGNKPVTHQADTNFGGGSFGGAGSGDRY